MSDSPSRSLFKRQRRDPLRDHPIEDPFDTKKVLADGSFASTDLHRLNLQAQQLKSLRHEGLTTLPQLRRKIQILPHQVNSALRVLNDMQGRAIMADEVGLGKTIEAGIVMKELIARGKANSILILTPASLASQWQGELWDKFGEVFIKHTDPEFEGFTKHDKVVASIDTAKTSQHYPDIIGREWDLVVIDEAHYLKNKKTQRYKLADDLVARQALMLTATPIQNNLMELYNLINLIRPGLLGTLQHFEEEYIGDHQGRVLLHATRLQNLLKQVMIRNRRSETTGITFPERRVETHRVQASKGEYELHKAVTQFIREHKKAFDSHLALMILEREVASSAPALSKTLGNMMAKQNDNDVTMAMTDLRHQADSIKRNAKVNLIVDVATKQPDKMIVFTQFRETQELLARRLKAEGVSTLKFHGQMSPGRKRTAIMDFKNSDTQVMIATDSGSEGLNLQFCHILINYDLPWNPMRVEQRIGRVHRIGQMKEYVVILNLAVADTIEDYVLQVLYEKIKLFEVAIGEMDLILSDINDGGGIEKRIMDVIMDSDSDDDVKDELSTIEKEMERSKKDAQAIKELDASVFQQFDLSTANDEVSLDSKVDMQGEVASFMRNFIRVLEAEVEDADGIQTLRLPRPLWKRLGGVHQFTNDLEVFDAHDGEIELLSLGSPFIQDLFTYLDQDGSVGQLRTAEVDEPAVMFYFRYYIETIRSEVESFATVTVSDGGKTLNVVDGLQPVPDGETVARAYPVDEEALEEAWRNARFEVGSLIVPALQEKRDEAAEELRRAEKRLEAYYDKMRDEIRQDEAKLRRKIGENRNRRYFTENGVVERKLEMEYDKLQAQLHDLGHRNNRRIEQIDAEQAERLGREREKNEPRLEVSLIGATRLLPPKE